MIDALFGFLVVSPGDNTIQHSDFINIKWHARRLMPPSLLGRSRQRAGIPHILLFTGILCITRCRAWCLLRAQLYAQLYVASGIWRERSSPFEMLKKCGPVGTTNKKSWSMLKYPSSFSPTSLDQTLWLYRIPSLSWMARSL
jgi:hypothetical protein